MTKMGSSSGSANGCADAAKDADRSQGRKNPTGVLYYVTARRGESSGSKIPLRAG